MLPLTKHFLDTKNNLSKIKLLGVFPTVSGEVADSNTSVSERVKCDLIRSTASLSNRIKFSKFILYYQESMKEKKKRKDEPSRVAVEEMMKHCQLGWNPPRTWQHTSEMRWDIRHESTFLRPPRRHIFKYKDRHGGQYCVYSTPIKGHNIVAASL